MANGKARKSTHRKGEKSRGKVLREVSQNESVNTAANESEVRSRGRNKNSNNSEPRTSPRKTKGSSAEQVCFNSKHDFGE